MRHLFGSALDAVIDQPTVLTIGNFDGLHIGHRKLIDTVKAYAERLGLTSLVFSFRPHPAAVLGNKDFQMINSPEERLYLLSRTGIDLFIEYPFDNAFAQTTPEAFIQTVLFEQLRCKAVIIGEGNRFGQGRRGSYAMLKMLGERHGVSVVSVPHEKDAHGEKISSSGIKKLIAERAFALLENYLTVPYFIMGTVAHGRKVGRTIGFPTVNLMPYPHKLLPPPGIYLTTTVYDHRTYFSITNIGNNPTFHCQPVTIETYLFDFDREIYGEEIRLEFHGFIREEQKFPSADALRAQIQKDMRRAKETYGIR